MKFLGIWRFWLLFASQDEKVDFRLYSSRKLIWASFAHDFTGCKIPIKADYVLPDHDQVYLISAFLLIGRAQVWSRWRAASSPFDKPPPYSISIAQLTLYQACKPYIAEIMVAYFVISLMPKSKSWFFPFCDWIDLALKLFFENQSKGHCLR